MPRAFEQPFKYITGIPAVDFTEKRYYGVKFNTDGNIVLAGAGDPIVGVIQEPNDIDEPAQVMQSGITFAVFGGIVADGAEVSMDANGKFVAASTATFTDKTTADHILTTSKVVGIAVVGAGADLDIGCVLLK